MIKLKNAWLIFTLRLWTSFGFPLSLLWHRSIQRLGRLLVEIGLKLDDSASQWLWQHKAARLNEPDRYADGDLVDRY